MIMVVGDEDRNGRDDEGMVLRRHLGLERGHRCSIDQ